MKIDEVETAAADLANSPDLLTQNFRLRQCAIAESQGHWKVRHSRESLESARA